MGTLSRFAAPFRTPRLCNGTRQATIDAREPREPRLGYGALGRFFFPGVPVITSLGVAQGTTRTLLAFGLDRSEATRNPTSVVTVQRKLAHWQPTTRVK
jgi:hypothetical protein